MAGLPTTGGWGAAVPTGNATVGSSVTTGGKYLPPVTWDTKGVPPKDVINSTATDPKNTQLTVAAQNAAIPILYGTTRIGPKIAYVVSKSAAHTAGTLVILAIWGHGPVDSIQQMWVDDKAPSAGITFVHRLGGEDNNVIPTQLTAAIPGYNDTLPGICYSVITANVGSSSGFPRLNALIKGKKVYDPRQNLLLQSNTFDTTWTQTGTPTLLKDAVDPFGHLNSAWTISDDNAAATEYISQSVFLADYTYTYSVRVKKTIGAQASYPVLAVSFGTTIANITIDTTNGIVTPWTAYTGYTIIPTTSTCKTFSTDYWIVELTFTTTPGAWEVIFVPAATTNSVQSTGLWDVAAQGTAVIYGAQLEENEEFGGYVETTTTISFARENIFLQSNSFTTTWVSDSAAPVQNATDPFGVTNSAWTLTDNNASVSESISQTTTLKADEYMLALYVKKTVGAQTSYPVLMMTRGLYAVCCTVDTTNGISYPWIDYTDKLLVSSYAVCEDVSTDFWLVEIVFTVAAGDWATYIFPAGTSVENQNTGIIDVTVQGSSIVYGAQLKRTSVPNGYINTTTSKAEVYSYSDNPSLCLSDFITDDVYGMGLQTDLVSVGKNASLNSVIVGGEVLRTLNLAMEQTQTCEAWLETLRAYAACWLTRSGSVIKFIPDSIGNLVYTFDHADGTILSVSNIAKRGLLNTPNYLTINYTDTSSIPYKSAPAILDISGVASLKESSVDLPGINRYSQAYRETIERLNKLVLNDLSFNMDVFDVGITFEVGDIVGVKHPIGIADQDGNAKLMRISNISNNDAGRYTLSLIEYDPIVYSTTVNPEPTFTDTGFSDPSNPPIVLNLLAAEEVYQLENGQWSSRLKVTWDDNPTYPYLSSYQVEVFQAGILVETANVRELTYSSGPLKELVEYVVKVAIRTSVTLGDWSQYNSIPQGKYLLPGNVPQNSLEVFEAGGRVYVSWDEAVDKDISKYDVRYGAVGGTYETATSIDHVDALRLQTDQIPTGDWTIYVKAEDSVGQYSVTAASKNVTVTSDSSSFLIDTLYQTNPQWQNMLLQSNAFTTTWSATGTPSATQDAIDLFGVANNAWTLTDNDVGAVEYISQAVTLTAANHNYSVFVKKTVGAQTSYPILRTTNAALDTALCTIDTSNGTATIWTGYTSYTIVTSSASCKSYNSEFWRVDITFLGTAASWDLYLIPAGTTNSTQATGVLDVAAQGSAVFYGAQLSATSIPHEYQPTTTVAIIGGEGMLKYTLHPTDSNMYYVTEDNQTAASKFPSTASTYTNVTATYHNSQTSLWQGEAEDFGIVLSGNWEGASTVADLSGTHSEYLSYSLDGTTYTDGVGLSQKVNARFARLKYQALTSDTIKVTIPTHSIRISAIPREEVGTGTSSASNATTCYLNNDYTSTNKISVSVLGTTAASHTEDNIGHNMPNSADKGTNATLTTNTLTCTTAVVWTAIRGKHPIPPTGKWYWEYKVIAGGATNKIMVGVITRGYTLNATSSADPNGMWYYGNNGNKYPANSAYGATYTTNDIIGVAYDSDLGKITFFKNNTTQGELSGLSGEKFPAMQVYSTDTSVDARFESNLLTYAPPTGFIRLPYAFDEHIFNDAGARVSRDFLWSFQGV